MVMRSAAHTRQPAATASTRALTGPKLNTVPARWLPGRSPDGRGYMMGLGKGRRIAIVDLPHDGRTLVFMDYGDRCDPADVPAGKAFLLRPDPRSDGAYRPVAALASPRLPWLDDALRAACNVPSELLGALPSLSDQAAIAMLASQTRKDRIEQVGASERRARAAGPPHPVEG